MAATSGGPSSETLTGLEIEGKEPVVYLNGEIVPESQAKVSVFDRAFLYGDGAFESLTATNGRVFKLREHMERLFRSLKSLGIEIPLGLEEMEEAVLQTVRANNPKEAYIRVVVSRGPGYPLLDARVATNPTIVVFLHNPTPPPSVRGSYGADPEGLKVIIASIRKAPPVALESRIKSLNYLNNVMARLEAINAGADEAIILDINNFVAEGAGDNIFVVKDGRIFTPFGQNILEGITRQTVIDLAREEGFEVAERNLTHYDLYTADEVFLSSSFGHVLPVAQVNGRKIGQQRPGPVSLKLKKAYERLVLDERYTRA